MSIVGRPEWLTTSVGYEVYIRSFGDGNGNGVGDLPGVLQHLEYLAWLGVDIVWLTPFFPSPMADYGYDVGDYVGVAPVFGTLADLDLIVERAHELGLKIVIDIVPNHSSETHPWFEASRSSIDNPFRDHYIWRDPGPDGGPPNNWLSHFGGPAWTLDRTTGQYYLHLFLPEQPDLNWRNPKVRDEFLEILRVWLDRGVDGFRIDVAHALVKDEQLRDNPMLMSTEGITDARYLFACMDHAHDLTQPETLEIYRSWRMIADEYDAALIGETYVLDAADLAAMVPGDGLHVGFWFVPMHMEWTADAIRPTLSRATEEVSDRVGWVQSSHDESRPVTRYGGGDLGRRRSLGLSVLMMGLPGVPFIYQGEELGLDDGFVPADRLTDPVATRNEGSVGRDGCRTPMPWGPGANLGFSTAPDTWLPVGHGEESSVAAQLADPESHLHKIRALLSIRRKLIDPTERSVEWLATPDELIAFRRGNHVYVLNAGAEPVEWEVGNMMRCLYSSTGPLSDVAVSSVTLAADQALILGPASAGVQ